MEVFMKRLNATLFIVPALLVAGSVQAQAPAPAPGAGGPGAVTPETVLANNDANKDGIITKEEATKAARNLILRWDVADLNKDDKVDTEEIKKWLAAGGVNAPAPGGAPGAAPGAAPPPAAPAAPPAAK
jgi:hypothetical protein